MLSRSHIPGYRLLLLFSTVILVLSTLIFVWVYGPKSSTLSLTTAEKEWLAAHQNTIVVAGDPAYVPIDFYNEKGEHDGVAEEFMKLIEEKLSIHFQRRRYPSWSEVLARTKAGEVDVISNIAHTPEREKYLNFTTPYLELPTFLVARQQRTDIKSIQDLAGKKVALSYQYGSYEYFRTYHPEIQIVPVHNDGDALQKVSLSETDAAISDLPSISHYGEKQGISNLRIVGQTEFRWRMSFGVKKEQEILYHLLNKALNDIDSQEKDTRVNKWISTRFDKYESLEKVLILILITSLLSLLVTLLYMLWNTSLKKEVAKQTTELNTIKNNLEQLVDERTAQLNQTVQSLEKYISENHRLFSIIAHDLKGPFDSLIGLTDLILSESSPATYEEQQEYIRLIQYSSRKAYTLLINLLEWSVSKSGELELRFEQLDAHELIHDTVQALQVMAYKKEIQFIYPTNSPCLIESDKRRLATILRNLISNALKYSLPKGIVTIETTPVVRDAVPWLEIRIQDTGIGMQPDKVTQLFRVDSNLSTVGTAGEKGTGLGLVLCKEFADDIKGRLEVQSILHEGTLFKVCLPLHPQKQETTKQILHTVHSA